MKRQAEGGSLALRALATSLSGLRTVGSGAGLGLPGGGAQPRTAPRSGGSGQTVLPGGPGTWDLGSHDTRPSRAPASGLPGPSLA